MMVYRGFAPNPTGTFLERKVPASKELSKKYVNGFEAKMRNRKPEKRTSASGMVFPHFNLS